MSGEVIKGFVTVANILVLIFCVFSVLLIGFDFSSTVKLCAGRRRCRRAEQKSDVELLTELERAESSNEKAGIFVSLIRIGYVLNHKLVNAGGKYDDRKQQVRFNQFLTPIAVEKLNGLDGMRL